MPAAEDVVIQPEPRPPKGSEAQQGSREGPGRKSTAGSAAAMAGAKAGAAAASARPALHIWVQTCLKVRGP